MGKAINVLAIEDHAIILEGYNTIFKSMGDTFGILNFVKARNCKAGVEVIEKFKSDPFEVAVVDYSIPPFAEGQLYTGEDMAGLLRRVMPNCKIIMMTMHNNAPIIGRILQKIKPEGFINKNDCTTDELIEGFKDVIQGKTYYTKTIANYERRAAAKIELEAEDVMILLLLAKGIRNDNLGKYIPISTNAIQKRKMKMKSLLESDGSDENLIEKAKMYGYI